MLATAAIALALFAAPAPTPIVPVTSPAVAASAVPSAFDPQGSPRANRATIRIVPQVDGLLGVDIVTGSGRVLAVLQEPVVVPAGAEQTYRWDAAGIRDGHYAVRARLTDTAGVTQEALTPISVDTTAPTVRLAAPRPAVTAKGPTRIRATFSDPSGIQRVSLLVESQSGVRVGSVTLPFEAGATTLQQRWDLRVGGRLLLPGVYHLRISAVDAVGRSGLSDQRLLRVERVVPSVSISSVPEAGRAVALTFDDCVNSGPWMAVLRALRAADVKGSFFCNGVNVRANPEAARATAAAGHTIGAHTWAHPMMTRETPARQRSQIEGDRQIWWQVARVSPAPYFRPPYGDVNAQVRTSAGQVGMAWTVMWNVDPSDYLNPAPAVIARRVVSASRPGSIVVMHTGDNTAAAIPAMVRGLRAKGLEPVSLEEMLGEASHLAGARRG